jgi:hypothetical protein
MEDRHMSCTGVDWSCYGDSAAVAALDPYQRARAEDIAWRTFTFLTGGAVSDCPITVLPAGRDVCREVGGRLDGGRGGILAPYFSEGAWRNGCGCRGGDRLELSGPVSHIVEVRAFGQRLGPESFHVEDARTLVRDDGGVWPHGSNTTTDDEFSITYHRGVYPGLPHIQTAVGMLAAEFYRACANDAKCKLPAGVTRIVRTGVSFEVSSGMFPNGVTGIKTVDAITKSLNPHGQIAQPGVFSLDSRPMREVTIATRRAVAPDQFGFGGFGDGPYGA